MWPHLWSVLALFFFTIKLDCQISDCNKAFPAGDTRVSWRLTWPRVFTLTHNYSCGPQRSDQLGFPVITSIVTSSQLYLEPKKAIFLSSASVVLTDTCVILWFYNKMLQFLPGAEASCSTQPHNYIIYHLNWSPFVRWPDFFLCPFHFRTRLGVWAFPSMLALCLMAPEGVRRRLNMGSRDAYTCQIKKNKGFVAWHLWDSWPSGWCLGRLFVAQVSVAAVKPRITKRRNERTEITERRGSVIGSACCTHVQTCQEGHNPAKDTSTGVVREAIKVISGFKTTWLWSLTGCSLLQLREVVERPGNEEGWPLWLTAPFVRWNWNYGFRSRSSTFSPPLKNTSGFRSHGIFEGKS